METLKHSFKQVNKAHTLAIQLLGAEKMRRQVQVRTLRNALRRCLINDPLCPFKRGDMIKEALAQTEPDIDIALPCWVVVQVHGLWGSEAVKTMPACLSVHASAEAAEAEAKTRQSRGESVIWHESVFRSA